MIKKLASGCQAQISLTLDFWMASVDLDQN